MNYHDKPEPRTTSKFLIVVSRIGSFVFHPLFMTAATAILLYSLVPDRFLHLAAVDFGRWIKELLLYTVIFPFVAISLFRLSGLISNARMHKARDRILPLIATMMFYILAYCVFAYKHQAPFFLRSLLLASSCATMIIFIINIFYKVSVHTTAAGILPGMCLVLMLSNNLISIVPLLLALVIAIFVGIIRWLLGAHTLGQILLGYTIGILSQIAIFFLLYS